VYLLIYLRAQVKVAEENRSFGASDHQDDEYQEQETKHVVHLTRPKKNIIC
jgi:hypothetical protein